MFADRDNAEQFATNFVKSFPGARGGTAIKMPSGWQVSMIDTEGLLPRLKGSKQVDNEAVKELVAAHAEDLADDIDSWLYYG